MMAETFPVPAHRECMSDGNEIRRPRECLDFDALPLLFGQNECLRGTFSVVGF